MRFFGKFLVFVFSVSTSHQVFGANIELPSFSRLTSKSENSSLSASCYGKSAAKEISCFFSKVEVSKDNSPQSIEDFFKASEKVGEFSAFKKQICPKLPKIKEAFVGMTKEKATFVEASSVPFEKACSACENMDCLKDTVASRIKEIETSTCKVSNQTFVVDLKLKSKNKWQGLQSGECFDLIATIERTDNGDWVYSNLRQPNEGTNAKAICKKLKDSGMDFSRQIIYSRDGGEQAEFNCKVIEFTF